MKFEIGRVIRAQHPSLPGHFPGMPIVPGVVILDEVVAAVAEWRSSTQLRTIRLVKFLRPLLPDQPFVIRLTASLEKDETEVNFSCLVANHNIVEGRLEIRHIAT